MKVNPPESAARPAASPEIRKGIARFMEHLRGERHASVHTLRAYQNELSRFAEYLGPEIRWKDIDHVFLRGFLSSLHSQGLSKVSVARALAALRSMYKWLAREGVVQQNPAKLVSSPKLPKKLPRVPTMEEMNGLLNSELPDAAAFPERDRAIFELLYGCGLRNSELVGIELNDIEETNGVILVRGKGKKQRYVPLEGAAHEALQAYRPARQDGVAAGQTGPANRTADSERTEEDSARAETVIAGKGRCNHHDRSDAAVLSICRRISVSSPALDFS
jgi:integrase/recombinase XerC